MPEILDMVDRTCLLWAVDGASMTGGAPLTQCSLKFPWYQYGVKATHHSCVKRLNYTRKDLY